MGTLLGRNRTEGGRGKKRRASRLKTGLRWGGRSEGLLKPSLSLPPEPLSGILPTDKGEHQRPSLFLNSSLSMGTTVKRSPTIP